MKLPNPLKQKEPETIENGEDTYPTDMIWIGIGNAGMKLLDKICFLDTESDLNEIYPIGIRTSVFDCQSPKNLEDDQIIDLGEEERRLVKGTGRNQSLAQQIFLKKKENILERIGQLTSEDAPFYLYWQYLSKVFAV